MADIKLLDCTLRDGGYVNDWQWGFGQARRIIQTLTARALMWSRWAFCAMWMATTPMSRSATPLRS